MESGIDNHCSLYRRTLGEAFDCLPPVLQRFHDQPDGGVAQGTLRITRGQGRIRHVLATLMRLPSPGEQVPVFLQVQVRGERECWTRDFGSLRLVTQQWLHRNLLIETAGPLRFGFRLSADRERMRFEFARCWFLGIPIPTMLAPRVNASVLEREEGWWVWVQVEVPWLGMLARYEGKVVPRC